MKNEVAAVIPIRRYGTLSLLVVNSEVGIAWSSTESRFSLHETKTESMRYICMEPMDGDDGQPSEAFKQLFLRRQP